MVSRLQFLILDIINNIILQFFFFFTNKKKSQHAWNNYFYYKQIIFQIKSETDDFIHIHIDAFFLSLLVPVYILYNSYHNSYESAYSGYYNDEGCLTDREKDDKLYNSRNTWW